jgi:hypothetical protein
VHQILGVITVEIIVHHKVRKHATSLLTKNTFKIRLFAKGEELSAHSSNISPTWRICYAQRPVKFVHQISGVEAVGNQVHHKVGKHANPISKKHPQYPDFLKARISLKLGGFMLRDRSDSCAKFQASKLSEPKRSQIQ